MRRALALAAGLAILLFPSPAPATDLFTVAGGGSAPLREGALAGTADITSAASDVAADPRGGFAFTAADELWHVGSNGRLHLLARADKEDAGRITYAADGALYRSSHHAILRTAVDGSTTVVAGRPDVAGFAGDGGLATAALLTAPEPLTFDRSAGLLIADVGRIRRLAPDGTITTVAQVEPPLPPGVFRPWEHVVRDAAVAPDGSVIVASDTAVRRIAPDGTITRIGPAVERVAVDAGGAVIAAYGETTGDGAWVERLTPAVQPLVGRSALVGFDVWNGVGALGGDTVFTVALEPTPDGGLLIAADFAIHYAPPPRPAVPAVAVTSARRTARGRIRVGLRTTVPATVRVRVKRGRRTLAQAEVTTVSPSTAVVLRGELDPAVYRVTAEILPAPGIAAASAEGRALIGALLPVRVARGIAETQAALLETYDNVALDLQPCRRISTRRVDCPATVHGDCAGILSMVWERSGHLSWTVYGQRRGACRIRADRGARRAPAAAERVQ